MNIGSKLHIFSEHFRFHPVFAPFIRKRSCKLQAQPWLWAMSMPCSFFYPVSCSVSICVVFCPCEACMCLSCSCDPCFLMFSCPSSFFPTFTCFIFSWYCPSFLVSALDYWVVSNKPHNLPTVRLDPWSLVHDSAKCLHEKLCIYTQLLMTALWFNNEFTAVSVLRTPACLRRSPALPHSCRYSSNCISLNACCTLQGKFVSFCQHL